MNSGKPKISTERARRILRIHHWVYFVILAVGVPAIVIAIEGYRSVWEVIFFFGFCALFAWSLYWTNWVNSVILAVGGPAIFIAIGGYRSIWEIIFLFGCFGFIVWSEWFWLWVKKRIEEFDEDKNIE
ncbi:MAG: hypothetical protein ABSB11_03775 [Sedimentisphaerales bacterium]|jgi:uncharacterized membrane protein YjjP (DUF1212 family)